MATKITTKNLSQKAMLVTLSISQWLARIRDPEISQKATKDALAKRSDIVSSTKALIPIKGAFKDLRSAISAIKAYHEIMTLPWRRNQRILPSSKYPKYSKQMRDLISKFDSIIPLFAHEFPSLKQEAKLNWGTLYNEQDYPASSDLSSKFGISLSVDPIPADGDWRVNLSKEELEKLNEEIEKQKQERLEIAMDALWVRIYQPIKHMVEVLNKDKPRIFESLITNIQNIVQLLPDLNMENDPQKEELRKKIEDKLCDITPDMLRESEGIRKMVLTRAEELRTEIKEVSGIEDDDIAAAMVTGYSGIYDQKKIKM